MIPKKKIKDPNDNAVIRRRPMKTNKGFGVRKTTKPAPVPMTPMQKLNMMNKKKKSMTSQALPLPPKKTAMNSLPRTPTMGQLKAREEEIVEVAQAAPLPQPRGADIAPTPSVRIPPKSLPSPQHSAMSTHRRAVGGSRMDSQPKIAPKIEAPDALNPPNPEELRLAMEKARTAQPVVIPMVAPKQNIQQPVERAPPSRPLGFTETVIKVQQPVPLPKAVMDNYNREKVVNDIYREPTPPQPAPLAPPQPMPPTAPTDKYDTLSKKSLQEECVKMGVKYTARDNKPDMIRKIRESLAKASLSANL